MKSMSQTESKKIIDDVFPVVLEPFPDPPPADGHHVEQESEPSKTCSQCHIPKPGTTAHFYRYRNGGLTAYCRECHIKRMAKHKEKLRENGAVPEKRKVKPSASKPSAVDALDTTCFDKTLHFLQVRKDHLQQQLQLIDETVQRLEAMRAEWPACRL